MGRLQSIDVQDGRPRTITFVTNAATGEILRRSEADSQTTGDPKETHYYFNGIMS